MDKIISYKYAYGSISDLKRGRFDKLDTEDFIEDALKHVKKTSKSRILIPEFIGVYQESELKADTLDERNYLKNLDIVNKLTEEKLESEADLVLQIKGDGDACHPRLIHIAYNSGISNPSIIRELFNLQTKRVVFSNYNKLPDFSTKDTTSIFQHIDILKDISSDIYEEDEKKKIASDAYNFLKQQMHTFGLTRLEYLLMNSLGDISSPMPENRKIITNTEMMGPLLEIFQKVLESKD